MENSIKEDIKILENFINWLKIDFEYDSGEEIKAIEHILSDYKRVLKENEYLKEKWDKDTHILRNELDLINANRLDLLQQNKELRKENEELNNRCRNLDKEAQAYLEELAGDNTLTRRTIKQLQEENEECKLDVQDYLKQAQENAEMYRKAQKKIQDLKAENEELKNNTRKNENELEFDIDCDWIALQKILDESEKSNEYISYKNEKWIKEKYCIPIKKVKDKIEELNRKIDKSIDNSKGGLDEEFIEKAGELLTQKRILQELLEKEK